MGKGKGGFLSPLFAEPSKEQEEELEKKRKEAAEKKNPLIQGKSLHPKFGINKHHLVMESMFSGVEKYYFWVLRFMRQEPNFGLGFEKVEKLRDVFDASVTSSFHGQVGSKLSAIQQQASQYLQTIGGLVKTIFPIVRELRIIDERLDYYKKGKKGDENAEIALKSIWIELVERGVENPNSVYGLATKVGFLTLPDLFFKINPKKGSEGIDAAVKSLKEGGVNAKVRDVVAKKLFQYYAWKEQTEKELTFRRDFTIKHLRSHYNTIKLYMNWVRPYLRTIKQLQVQGNYNDADLVSAFETAKIQLEVLAQKTGGYKHYFPCLLVKVNYVTLPELSYTPSGQKQPTHMGRTEITIQPFVLTQEQIEMYKKKMDDEDVELLSNIDATLMALKDDLKNYLKEAGEKFEEDKKISREQTVVGGIFEPFLALGDAFKDMFAFLIPEVELKGKIKEKFSARDQKEEYVKASTLASDLGWTLYDIFKKAHGLMTP